MVLVCLVLNLEASLAPQVMQEKLHLWFEFCLDWKFHLAVHREFRLIILVCIGFIQSEFETCSCAVLCPRWGLLLCCATLPKMRLSLLHHSSVCHCAYIAAIDLTFLGRWFEARAHQVATILASESIVFLTWTVDNCTVIAGHIFLLFFLHS